MALNIPERLKVQQAQEEEEARRVAAQARREARQKVEAASSKGVPTRPSARGKVIAADKYCVDGVVYDSAALAAEALGVNARTIKRWAGGYMSRGVFVQPDPNCYKV